MVLALAAMAGSMSGQTAHYAFATRPYVTGEDLKASRFWTKSTMALVALDGAAKAADSYATRKNIDGGGEEYNPLARPFVHTPAVQVASMAAMFGAEVVAAYWLHKRRHDHMAHLFLLGGATMNGLGAASSIKNRVTDW
jgi:hypothetical protein